MDQILPFFTYFNINKKNIINNEPLTFRRTYQDGGRQSGKSKSVNILFRDLWVLDCDVTMISFIELKSQVFDTIWTDIFNEINETRLLNKHHINLTRHTIKNKHATIECKGIKQQKHEKVIFKSFKQITTKYCIIHFEESNQISERHKQEIIQAIRGRKLKYKWIIHSTNPEQITNEHTQYLLKHLPEDEAALKSKGYQYKQENDTLFVRCNYRINPVLMQEKPEVIAELESYKEINYQRYRVWNLGLAGVGEGNVFGDYMGYLLPFQENFRYEASDVFGGMDFGYVKDATALLLFYIDDDGNIAVFYEFYFENSEKTSMTLFVNARNILNDIKSKIADHPLLARPFTIYCDNSDYAFINIMNKVAWNMGLKHISFVKTVKIALELRVGILISLLQGRSLSISPACYNLLREMSSAKYDTNKKRMQLIDDNNHCLDAFFYGIEHHLTFLE